MTGIIEKIYSCLLDGNYQEKLFGALEGFGKMGDGYIARCPFHEDTHPTLVIYRDRPEYFCFVCSARGDWLKYLQTRECMSFADALARLAGDSGAGSGGYGQGSWEAELQRSILLELVSGYFTTQLFAPPGEEVLNYLYKRGYAMGEVEGSAFGCYPGYGQTLEYLTSQGMDREYAARAMATVWKEGREDFRLTIPYRDSCGRLLGMVGRDISKTGADAYAGLTDLSALEDTPFLMYRARNKDDLIIVQGFLDALLVDQIGIKPAVAIGKSGLSNGCLDTIASSGVKRCLLCFGSGPEKKRLSLESARMIRSRGMDAAVLPLEDKYEDLDQFIRFTDLHDFKRLIKKPLSVEEWTAAD